MPDVLRCFVEVDMPGPVRDSLAAFARQAAPAFRGWRFGAARNLHVTLQFLGDVERGRIGSLTRLLESAVADLPAFSAALGEAGSFPERGAPRILHVSIGEGRQDLVRLATRVSSALGEAGFRPDKLFVPHITLARPKSGGNAPPGDAAVRWRDSFARFVSASPAPQWTVSEALLMESVLGPKGPTYIVRGVAPLGGSNCGAVAPMLY